jgi:putative iron-regulated protein
MRRLVLIAAALLLLQLPTQPVGAAEPPVDPAFAADYADNVVIPTYRQLADKLTALRQATATLQQTPNADNLTKARAAWSAARVPWELGEAFLFGPVENNGYDAALDTWPVSVENIRAVVDGNAALTPALVAGLEPEVKGFHALEYLLFGQDARKTVDRLTERGRVFAALVAAEMADSGQQLLASWTQGGDGAPPYRDAFVKSGGDDAIYASPGAVVEEVLGGISGILEEVAHEKIGGPLDAKDPSLAESRYSLTSLVDYKNNLRGALQAYTGDGAGSGARGKGLDRLVQAADPALNQRVLDGFNQLFAALERVPPPFETAILDPAGVTALTEVQTDLATLQDLFDDDLTALLIGSPEATESPADDLSAAATELLGPASQALEAGDLATARERYQAFEDRWQDLEDGVRAKSRDQYRAIEDAMSEVRLALLKPVSPDVTAAQAALRKLVVVIGAALPDLH